MELADEEKALLAFEPTSRMVIRQNIERPQNE
jgi:hypothetical protein